MPEYTRPEISELEPNVHQLLFSDGRKLIIVGTAHISARSRELVQKVIAEHSPDTVCVELDEQRYKNIRNKSRYENLDIIKIIRNGQVFFFIGNLIMSAFQKKMSDKTGSNPGDEFKEAIEQAESKGLKLALVDRNIGVTLKRAWRMTGFWGQMKIIASMFFGKKEDIDEKTIEDLKDMDALSGLIEELSMELPEIKTVLVDERDIYLTGEIQNQMGRSTVAVVGAGHVPGMLKQFDNRVDKERLKEMNHVPVNINLWKFIPWIIPLAIIGSFAWGAYTSDRDVTKTVIITWVLANGGLTALGCIIALAHPLVTITGFLAAPLTSLNPAIGAGMVTGMLQALLVRARVIDFINLQEDASQVAKWWKNRLLRIILVFLLSSLGSIIGTIVALPALRRFFEGI